MSDTNIPDLAEPYHLSEPYHGRSSEIAKLAAALCKAQAAMGGAKKDSTNPHFKNAYADLASIWDAVRKPLTDNGLAVVQFPRTTRGGVEVETMLVHSSGEYMTDVLWLPVLKMDAQGVGSAITYGRRYALMAVAGIAPVEDDDGNASTAGPPHKPGVPGSASGGTDFRPVTRRMVNDTVRAFGSQSSANGRRMANDDEHLLAGREKGSTGNGNGNAIKRAEWVRKAIDSFKAAQSKDELVEWWKAERERIEVIENAMPAEFERLIAAYDAAIERTARS